MLLLPTEAYITGGVLSVLASILIVGFVPHHWLGRLFRPLHLPTPSLPRGAADLISLAATAVVLGLGRG